MHPFLKAHVFHAPCTMPNEKRDKIHQSRQSHLFLKKACPRILVCYPKRYANENTFEARFA